MDVSPWKTEGLFSKFSKPKAQHWVLSFTSVLQAIYPRSLLPCPHPLLKPLGHQRLSSFSCCRPQAVSLPRNSFSQVCGIRSHPVGTSPLLQYSHMPGSHFYLDVQFPPQFHKHKTKLILPQLKIASSPISVNNSHSKSRLFLSSPFARELAGREADQESSSYNVI